MGGWKECSSDRGVEERGGQGEQLVMVRAVSWQDLEVRGSFKTKKREGETGEEREKEVKKTRSVYTKKCSASDGRTV